MRTNTEMTYYKGTFQAISISRPRLERDLVASAYKLVFRTFGLGKAPSAASFRARVEDEGVIDAFFGGSGLGAERGWQLGLAVPVAAGQVDPDGPAVS